MEVTEVNDGNIDKIPDGTTFIKMNGKLCIPKRLPNGLYKFTPDTGFDRAVLDCVTSLKNGADLLWIETPDPHVGKMAKLVNAVRREVPNAKLVYNNSPSFNWTLKLRYNQRDLTMRVCFSRISPLLAAVVQLLLWGRVNLFSHKFFYFCRQLPEMEVAFFNTKLRNLCENDQL